MKILAFDIESCTGSPNDASLCSLGYALYEDGKILRSDDILVNPLPKHFTLGGWGKEPKLKLAYPTSHFRKQPRFDGRYDEIKGLFSEADLVIGFAVQNDIKYLNDACDKFSLPRIPFKYLDVQLIAGHVMPDIKGMGLKTAASKFSIEFLEHRSDEDARVTLEVLSCITVMTEKSLEKLVGEYGVVYGENRADGYTGCYSRALIEERLATNSKNVRKMIVNYYIDHLPDLVEREGNALRGKGICIAESAYKTETDGARKVITTALKQGGRYEPSLLKCDYFISSAGDKSAIKSGKLNLRRVKVMTKEKFFEAFGEDDCYIDSYKVLEEHYAEFVAKDEEKLN